MYFIIYSDSKDRPIENKHTHINTRVHTHAHTHIKTFIHVLIVISSRSVTAVVLQWPKVQWMYSALFNCSEQIAYLGSQKGEGSILPVLRANQPAAAHSHHESPPQTLFFYHSSQKLPHLHLMKVTKRSPKELISDSQMLTYKFRP